MNVVPNLFEHSKSRNPIFGNLHKNNKIVTISLLTILNIKIVWSLKSVSKTESL